MEIVTSLLLLQVLHWLGDFVLQSNMMAREKFRSAFWLSAHSMVYGAVFLPFFGPLFALLCFLSHVVIDGLGSGPKRRAWDLDQYHKFFVYVGLDQAAHFAVLIGLYFWLGGI